MFPFNQRDDSGCFPGSTAPSSSKRRSSWRHLLTPSYKSRLDEFHKLFCDEIPDNEQLIADYSCALHREILIQGRLYISINYIAFYANIFSWITRLVVRLRDISEIYKANTARIIPNAIQIITNEGDKHIFASFVARDKSYAMLLRIWQNNLMNTRLSSLEIKNLVHYSYGKDLGLSDNEELKLDSPDPATSLSSRSNSMDHNNNSSNNNNNSNKKKKKKKNSGLKESPVTNIDSNTNSKLFKSKSSILESVDENSHGSKRKHFRYNSIDFGTIGKAGRQRSKQDEMIAQVVSKLNELKENGRKSSPSSSLLGNLGSGSNKSALETPVLRKTKSAGRLHGSMKYPSPGGEGSCRTETSDWEDNKLELTTHCGCLEHQGELISDQEFDINVDTLFTLIFTNSKFMRTCMMRLGMTDFSISQWKRAASDTSNSSTLSTSSNGVFQHKQTSPISTPKSSTKIDDQQNEQQHKLNRRQSVRISQVRQLNYNMNVEHMWAKQVQIEERQNICQVKPGLYVLKSQSANSGIPYGETFTCDVTYCLTRQGDIDRSRMLVHCYVNFKKDKMNWKLSMVKSMIERQTVQGVKNFIRDLTDHIKDYVDETLKTRLPTTSTIIGHKSDQDDTNQDDSMIMMLDLEAPESINEGRGQSSGSERASSNADFSANRRSVSDADDTDRRDHSRSTERLPEGGGGRVRRRVRTTEGGKSNGNRQVGLRCRDCGSRRISINGSAGGCFISSANGKANHYYQQLDFRSNSNNLRYSDKMKASQVEIMINLGSLACFILSLHFIVVIFVVVCCKMMSF